MSDPAIQQRSRTTLIHLPERRGARKGVLCTQWSLPRGLAASLVGRFGRLEHAKMEHRADPCRAAAAEQPVSGQRDSGRLRVVGAGEAKVAPAVGAFGEEKASGAPRECADGLTILSPECLELVERRAIQNDLDSSAHAAQLRGDFRERALGRAERLGSRAGGKDAGKVAGWP